MASGVNFTASTFLNATGNLSLYNTFLSSKQENYFTTSLICTNITYGSLPAPNVASKYGEPYFEYSTNSLNGFSTTVPFNAGEYFVRAVVDEARTYTGLVSEPIKFEIYKANYTNKELDVPLTTKYETNSTLLTYANILIEKYKISEDYHFININDKAIVGKNTLKVYYNADPLNYNNFYFDIEITLELASINISLIEWTTNNSFTLNENGNFVFVYDGTQKSVFLTGLPNEIVVTSYINNRATDVGTYTASCNFTFDSNFVMPILPTCTFEIIKAPLPQSVLSSITYTITNGVLTFSCNNNFDIKIKIDLTDSYSTNVALPEYTTYTVFYKISSANYVDYEGSMQVKYENTSSNNSSDSTSDNINNSLLSTNNNDSLVIIILVIGGVVIITTLVIIVIYKKRK